jgi:hypothetical protein
VAPFSHRVDALIDLVVGCRLRRLVPIWLSGTVDLAANSAVVTAVTMQSTLIKPATRQDALERFKGMAATRMVMALALSVDKVTKKRPPRGLVEHKLARGGLQTSGRSSMDGVSPSSRLQRTGYFCSGSKIQCPKSGENLQLDQQHITASLQSI